MTLFRSGVYKLAYQRWRAAVQAAPLAVRIEAKVRGRLALGLGIESVTEIGCRLHHTYGVPVIPASGLKGALRAAMVAPEDVEAWKKRSNFLFGSPESLGFADVLDAWWVPEPGSGLAVDVVTAHHPAYYTGSADAAPTDFDDPVPNHFLTITGKFAFAVVAPNESWKQFIDKLLRQVLEDRGLGAKRSSGYGRFHQIQPW